MLEIWMKFAAHKANVADYKKRDIFNNYPLTHSLEPLVRAASSN